jgi:hypothetical protein
MQKTKILSKDNSLVIEGRYVFDYGEGWNIVNISKPYTVDEKKCFMCDGKGKIKGLSEDFKCDLCDGTGILEEKTYPVNPNQLADMLQDILVSGDEFKITIDVTNRKPATMWKGVLSEGKEGNFLLSKREIK